MQLGYTAQQSYNDKIEQNGTNDQLLAQTDLTDQLLQGKNNMQVVPNIIQPVYDYNGNADRPTLEQYCAYKNVLPITFNNLDNTRAVFNFLREKQPQDKELLDEFLQAIYNFANHMSSNTCTYWGSLSDVIDSYWQTANSWGRYAPRDYNNVAPAEPTDNTTTNSLKTVKIDLQSINEIISRIQLLQNQINPNRYNNKNPLYGYRKSNIMEVLYYISNAWVHTTQDIIYVINKEINNYNGNRIQIKNKIIQPCYDVLDFTCKELKNLFKNNVFLLNNLEANDNTKEVRNTVQRNLDHFMRQNDLNIKLDDFKKDYLDKYPANAAYYNSLLKQNIFEKEKQIIDKIEEYREKFKQKTQELEANKNEIKDNKFNRKPFEDYLFNDIRGELNSPHFKYERKLKQNIESLQNELNALNNNTNIISDVNQEEKVLNKYNEKFIKESNEYLENMWKNINYNTDSFIKYYSKSDDKELAQYKQEQLKNYENEINELKDFIKQELTINLNNNKIQNINYAENINQLLKTYTD